MKVLKPVSNVPEVIPVMEQVNQLNALQELMQQMEAASVLRVKKVSTVLLMVQLSTSSVLMVNLHQAQTQFHVMCVVQVLSAISQLKLHVHQEPTVMPKQNLVQHVLEGFLAMEQENQWNVCLEHMPTLEWIAALPVNLGFTVP